MSDNECCEESCEAEVAPAGPLDWRVRKYLLQRDEAIAKLHVATDALRTAELRLRQVNLVLHDPSYTVPFNDERYSDAYRTALYFIKSRNQAQDELGTWMLKVQELEGLLTSERPSLAEVAKRLVWRDATPYRRDDDKRSMADWVAAITNFAARSMPDGREPDVAKQVAAFRASMLEVAMLALAAVEATTRQQAQVEPGVPGTDGAK